ncbi:hypothetical protein CTAYLR_009011 [Chrysophaeum taylorii]|uniref:PDZ domain-containing protein n=1 Tax=Chrysophaeum taylorii TaxID=2483200 RepID=A0AAD7ULV6_9STRA|nr:hypothetical protein CTAYLR_009011 [Chrysophaeum taylorii]
MEDTDVTPPKAVQTTFYDWKSPGVRLAKQPKQTVAISHPALRSVVNTSPPKASRSDFTPLSKRVAAENVLRDAKIGEAYAARRDALDKAGKLFDVVFEAPGQLGFKILLARSKRSTRRRVLVDETFDSCVAYDILRPRDEIVAIDGDLLIEMDPEAFSELVTRLRTKRPLELTFAKGAGRDEAFKDQCDQRRRASRLLATSSDVTPIAEQTYVNAPEPDDQARVPFCGAICAGVTIYACDYNIEVNDADYNEPLPVTNTQQTVLNIPKDADYNEPLPTTNTKQTVKNIPEDMTFDGENDD